MQSRFAFLWCYVPHHMMLITALVQSREAGLLHKPHRRPCRCVAFSAWRRHHLLAFPLSTVRGLRCPRICSAEQSPPCSHRLVDSALCAVKKQQPCPSSAWRNDAAKWAVPPPYASPSSPIILLLLLLPVSYWSYMVSVHRIPYHPTLYFPYTKEKRKNCISQQFELPLLIMDPNSYDVFCIVIWWTLFYYKS